MSAPEQVLWAVYTNTDLTEGRGTEYVKHFCKLRATADRLAHRGYVQGSDCPVAPVHVLLLDGQHVLSTSLIRVEQPTPADENLEAIYVEQEHAIAKAKANGLTDADIAAIKRGRP